LSLPGNLSQKKCILARTTHGTEESVLPSRLPVVIRAGEKKKKKNQGK
jgi:hypothetical protein